MNYFKSHEADHEFLSLKYYSFLQRMHNNSIKAYSELKKNLQDNQIAESVQFRLFCIQISKAIEYNIQIKLEESKRNANQIIEYGAMISKSYNEHLEVLEKFQQQFTEQFIKIAESKIEFLNKLQNGYSTLNKLKDETLKFSKQLFKIKESYFYQIKANCFDNFRNNIILLRMNLKFFVIAMNDQISAQQELTKIDELIQKEFIYTGIQNKISSLTFFLFFQKFIKRVQNGDSIYLTGTLLSQSCKILNKKSEKIANFFHYGHSEFKLIDDVENLLPLSLKSVHYCFVRNFIQSGNVSYLKKQKQPFDIQQSLQQRSLLQKWGRLFISSFSLSFTYFCFLKSKFLFKYDAHSYLNSLTFYSIQRWLIQQNFILIDGKIDGFSESLQKELELTNFKMADLYNQLHIFHLIPNLFESVNLKEKESQISQKNRSVSIYNNENFILYIPYDRNFEKYYRTLYDEDGKSTRTITKSQKVEKQNK